MIISLASDFTCPVPLWRAPVGLTEMMMTMRLCQAVLKRAFEGMLV